MPCSQQPPAAHVLFEQQISFVPPHALHVLFWQISDRLKQPDPPGQQGWLTPPHVWQTPLLHPPLHTGGHGPRSPGF